jgi:hypothetical protein
MCVFLLWVPRCLHWPFCPGVFIAILAFVAAAVTFWDHPPRWVKALSIAVFLFLMVGEVWMMSADRERNDADQEAARSREELNFKTIAAGIQGSIEQSRSDFDVTMGQFAAQRGNLARLQQQETRLEHELSEKPLSDMSSAELATKARVIAHQMRACLQNYQYQDNELSMIYYDHLEGQGSGMTAKDKREWKEEEGKKRNDLKLQYEAFARIIIAAANRIRAQMVKFVGPLQSTPDDANRAPWFEKPSPDERGLTLLYKLKENADYLDNLAGRMTSAAER